MQKCIRHEICGLEVCPEDPEGVYCFLHMDDPKKDRGKFMQIFETYDKGEIRNWSYMHIPIHLRVSGRKIVQVNARETNFYGALVIDDVTDCKHMDFDGAVFHEAVFMRGTTVEYARFYDASFKNNATFQLHFSSVVDFRNTTFEAKATFQRTKFLSGINCEGAIFKKPVAFDNCAFGGIANFKLCRFFNGVDFRRSQFNCDHVSFLRSVLSGKMLFSSLGPEKSSNASQGIKLHPLVFAGACEVDFREIELGNSDVIVFRDTDLSRCRFVDTDLRKIMFANVKWPRNSERICIYDEQAPLNELPPQRASERVEQAYRELKHNCEEQKNYELAGDFHYAEKDLRLKNSGKFSSGWLLLIGYRLFSGYGERWGRPIWWAVLLLVASCVGFIKYGIAERSGTNLDCENLPEIALYTLRAMLFLRPDDPVPISFMSKLIFTIDSVVGPLFFGLFALAIRQRLKR